MNTYSSIGARIRTIRKSKGLKAKFLYDKCAISKQAWSNYEHDRRTPELYRLIDISDELSVSLDYLACRTNIPYDPKDEDFSNLMAVFLKLKPEERRKLIDTAKKYRSNDYGN